MQMATKRTLSLSALQQNLAYLFDDKPHELSRPFEHWLAASKPFSSFAQAYQQKIRKKVRGVRDAEEMHNLYCELRTAYLLLQEPKFAVEYEPYGMRNGRTPDFAVTYRANTIFHIEVTRLRISQQEQQLVEREAAEGNRDLEEKADLIRRYESRRLAHVVCDKLGQLSPNTANVLLVWVQSRVLHKVEHELEIEQTLLTLKRRAEQRDAELLARHGFRNPADFIRSYQRLSTVLVQNLQAPEADKKPLAWRNNDARHPLPSRIEDILCSLITPEDSTWIAQG
jgi:hypothetical protein